MNFKYKEKVYSSDDIPILIFFNKDKDRRDFLTTLTEYTSKNKYKDTSGLKFVIAGNTILKKTKQDKIFILFKTIEEKKHIQKAVFELDDDNTVISMPDDISIENIDPWVKKYVKMLKKG